MNKIKVLVCGTNFGRFYLSACEQCADIQLTGILSRGSAASREFAKKYQVPIYTSVKDVLVEEVDVAVVAARTLITGGKSKDTVKALLEKGIPVMQEQPVHEREVQEILSGNIAQELAYCVTNFYRYMPAVDRFIHYAGVLKQEYEVLRLRLSCSSQVLYALVDVVYDIFGEITDFEVQKIMDGNMCLLAGQINGVPFTLNYYNEYSLDNDGGLALFFDIQIDTTAGNLILNDPEGEVTWQTHLVYGKGADVSSELFVKSKPLEKVFDGRASSYAERYMQIWPKAMGESIKHFFEISGRKEDALQVREKTQKQCEMCGQINMAAGRPKKMELPYEMAVSLGGFVDIRRS